MHLLSSIWRYKCPRCRVGDLYEGPALEAPFKMSDRCSYCGQRYEIETGFYWGAMYVAYAIAGGIMLSVTALGIFVVGWGSYKSLLVAAVLVLLCYVFVFRMSRSIWIHIYVKYRPEAHRAALDKVEAEKADHDRRANSGYERK